MTAAERYAAALASVGADDNKRYAVTPKGVPASPTPLPDWQGWTERENSNGNWRRPRPRR